MPIYNGNYVAPVWINNQPPAIDETEMRAMSQRIEASQVLTGSGAPTQYVSGFPGQRYADTTTYPYTIYKLVRAAEDANEWVRDDADGNLAFEYDSTATYLEGDYCLRGGLLYKAKQDISTAEAWTAAHWDRAHLADDVSGMIGLIDKPPRISSTGYWEVWDPNTSAYVSTGYTVIVNPPMVASTAAAMTNQQQVYIYTGSETGYQTGYWYYYNGSAWVPGGAYQVAATDKTLTVTDAAADAKATGDAVGELKSALTLTNQNTTKISDVLGSFVTNWSNGMVDASDGHVVVSGKNTAVSDFIEHDGNRKYIIDIPSTMRVRAFLFSTDTVSAPIGDTKWHDGEYTISISTAGYIRICARFTDGHVVNSYTDITKYIKITTSPSTGALKSVEDNASDIVKATSNRDNINQYLKKICCLSGDFYVPCYNQVIMISDGTIREGSTNRITSEKIPYDNSYFTVLCDDTIKTRMVYYRSDNSVFIAQDWITGTHVYRATSSDISYLRIMIAYANDAQIDNGLLDKVVIRYSDYFNTEYGTTIGVFEKWGVIGDSYSRGRYHYSSELLGYSDWASWGAIISRKVGNECLLLGVGGINTRTWLTVSISSGGGLAKMLASDPQQLYFLCLGINDTSLGLEYIGTVEDIHDNDYTQNADTFYGNYGRIIAQCKEHSPDCCFIISKLVASNDETVTDAFNDAIDGIAEHYGIPVIDPHDDAFFDSSFYLLKKQYGHPVAVTYGGMANAYDRLISKCIVDNVDYFIRYIPSN